jgi:hypothetical protein
VLAALFVIMMVISGLSAATAQAAHAANADVRPNKIGGLDCNGLSPVQKPVKRGLQCTDPRGTDEGRFEDNGHYIGHDEPSVRFLSNQPGSGSNYSMTERLPVEPRALPTVRHPGRDVTHTFELTIAPLDLDHRLRPAVHADAALHAGIRRQRAERHLSGCGRGIHGPYDKAAEDPNLEPDDSPCFKFGDTHGGTAAPNLVTGCDVFFDAVGDLDFDGTSYNPDWPDSVVPDRFPSTFLQLQPTTVGGHRYPQIQFMTDTSASELNTNCDLNSGAGCVLPPQAPGISSRTSPRQEWAACACGNTATCATATPSAVTRSTARSAQAPSGPSPARSGPTRTADGDDSSSPA